MTKDNKDIMSDIMSELNNGLSDDEVSHAESLDTVSVSKEFKENVVKYIKYDDLIKQKQDEINNLKDQRKPCEAYILKYLDQINQTTISVSDGKLMKKKTESKKALSQDIVNAVLMDKIKDPKKVEEIIKSMDVKRPTVENVNLKRTRQLPKKKNSTKK